MIFIYGIVALIVITLLFLFIKNHDSLQKIKMDLGLGSIIFGALIAIYSLILAFVVIVVWQQYQVTGDRIEAEASKLFNVYRSTFAYKDTATSKNLRIEINNYIKSVQADEWPAIEHDSLSTKTQQANNRIWHIVIHDLKAGTEEEKIWYRTTIDNMNQFSEARHLRLSDMESSIPKLMWYMLLFGAGVIIGFSMVLHGEKTSHHLIKVLLISVMIIFSLLLVFALDHPFKGVLRITPSAFEKIRVGGH